MKIFDWLVRKQQSQKINTGKIFEEVKVVGMPSPTDLQALKRGIQSTVTFELKCSGCEEKWHDALVPNEVVQVICPYCGGANRVRLDWSQVHFIFLED